MMVQPPTEKGALCSGGLAEGGDRGLGIFEELIEELLEGHRQAPTNRELAEPTQDCIHIAFYSRQRSRDSLRNFQGK